MRAIAFCCLLLTACGGSAAPTITHSTIVQALKYVCAAVQQIPSDTPSPTAGGEVP